MIVHCVDVFRCASLDKMTRAILQKLPHYCKGEIVKGFGRGSKELGIPTANFPDDVVDNLPEEIQTGIYFGYATVDNGPVHKMVMSIGWNPFYNNEKRSMETHILQKFEGDLYGKLLKVIIVGYLRSEIDFTSLDVLIEAINKDISNAEKKLNEDEDLSKYEMDEFLK